MKITSKFVLRDRKNQDKSQSVLMRITLDRKSFYICTSVRLENQYWDEKNGYVKTNHKSNFAHNAVLSDLKTSLDNFVAKSMMEKTTVTPDLVKHFFNPEVVPAKNDFYSFVENYLKTIGRLNLCHGSFKHHNVYLRTLKKFKPYLTFEEITTDFLSSYELYLKEVIQNHTNTIHNKMKFIRTYINMAIGKGLINNYVFKSYKLKQKATMPKFLTPDEFEVLEVFYKITGNPFHKKHLQYFLFACVTGLRYSDLKQLTWENIEDGKIIIQMQKTGQYITVPISKRAYQYLPPKGGNLIFNVPTNQCANKILKEIGKIVNSEKNLSCHVARHTFATLSLELDMPLVVIQRLLGHSTIKTTQIYAKIVDKRLETEMLKWEAF